MSVRWGSRPLFLAALVALVLTVGGCSGSTTSTQKSPAPLPNATLQSFDGGRALDLSTLRGPAVVNVWASWCGPCRRELPLYEAFSQEHADKVKVIGIDFQDTRKDKARQLIRRTGVTYPLYEDPGGLVRSRVLPQVILVDEMGRVSYEKYVEITSTTQLERLVTEHLGVSL